MRHTFACPSANVSRIPKNTSSQLSAESRGQELSPLDVAPGVAVVNSNYLYLSINATLAAMHGRSTEEHIGRSVVDAVQQSVHHLLLPAYREVITTGIAVENIMVEALAGPHLKRCIVSYYPVKVGNDPLWGVQVVARDVTSSTLYLRENAYGGNMLSRQSASPMRSAEERLTGTIKNRLDRAMPHERHLAPQFAPNGVRLAAAHITHQYSDPVLSVDMVSKLLNLSARHLNRLFRRHLGVTFHRYLRNMRMTKASELLAETGYSIKAIAAMVGYNSPSHFCDDFRRIMGRTPLQFRNAVSDQVLRQ